MKIISTLILTAAFGCSAVAQTTITNGGFENWGNPSPGVSTEPTNWYSDQSGSTVAALGPQTCFQTGSSPAPHSGTYCVKVETESYLGIETVNGVITTGVVNAPTTDKTKGYIGTINYSTASDIRRMAFTGKPDSLVGWYQYTPGAATERGKIRAILHIGNYFDPETPTTYHADPSDSQIASALFVTDTPGTTVSTWTRFSVPFTYTTGRYASGMTPQYIMINVTPSNNQATTVNNSTLYLDDLEVVYASTGAKNVSESSFNVTAYPNPVEDQVTINITGTTSTNGKVILTDISGRVISTIAANSNTVSMSMSGLSAGIYLIRYVDATHTQTIKITKE